MGDFAVNENQIKQLRGEFGIVSSLPKADLIEQLNSVLFRTNGHISTVFDRYDEKIGAPPIGSFAVVENVDRGTRIEIGEIPGVQKIVRAYGVA